MSSRKATPDVLGAVLGGTAGDLAESMAAPVAANVTANLTANEVMTGPAASTDAGPVEWEYREVLFRDYRGWRARAVNGVELGDWKNSPTVVEYLEQAGREGWELVSMSDRHNNHKEAYFKRPKSSS